jgi:hypothetical protein
VAAAHIAGSHVPKLGSPQLGWLLLAFVTTVAGNFTLIGSVLPNRYTCGTLVGSVLSIFLI